MPHKILKFCPCPASPCSVLGVAAFRGGQGVDRRWANGHIGAGPQAGPLYVCTALHLDCWTAVLLYGFTPALLRTHS